MNPQPRTKNQEPRTGSPSRVSSAIWRWKEPQAPDPALAARERRRKSLIESAVILCVGLLLAFLFGKRVLGTVVVCIGVLVLIGGQFAPPVYRGFKKLGGLLARGVGQGLTWLLLAPFFYICFTLGRILLVILRKDPLKRGFPAKDETYWVEHRPLAPDHYQRQY